MVRLIKRYESRKLYDTEESRYVSLEEIAAFVRRGQEVSVRDNASGEDVTAQTLTQIILEDGKSGRSHVPTELLHDLVRMGERALSTGVEQVQQGMDRLVQASIDRLGPVRQAREEMDVLKSRLADLERSLQSLEVEGEGEAAAPAGKAPRKAPRKAPAKRPRKKAPAKARRGPRKPTARKPAAAKA